LPDDEVDISISGVGRLQHGIYRRPSNSVSMKVRDPESGSRSSESH
jgi:hypothetical protein